MQRHCILTALFWATNLWFWADTGMAVAALPEVVVSVVGVAKWDVNLLPSPFSHVLLLAQTTFPMLPQYCIGTPGLSISLEQGCLL